jgi:molecular chaperone GrpE
MSDSMDKTEFEKILERKIAEEEARKKGDETPDGIPEEVPQNAEEADAPDAVSSPAQPAADSEVDLCQNALDQMTRERDALLDQLLRARADFDNYRKRSLRDMDQLRETASANLIRALLPVLDNFERALAHADSGNPLAEGVVMIQKQLLDVLSAEGLKPVEAKGAHFDPHYHEALAMTPAHCAPGIVLEEYERGYLLKEQLLRPAKVIVSCEIAAESSQKDEAASEQINDETAFSESEGNHD